MIKKIIVSITFFIMAIAAQAMELRSFYIDLVDKDTGGNATVYWGGYDRSETWTKTFQVYMAPYANIIGIPYPDDTIPNWITPVANGGATFEPVELFAVWGIDNEIFPTSMGNGFDFPISGKKKLFFPDDQAVWVVTLTPVTSVPEPESYALMLAGLGLMTVIGRKKTGKSSLSHS